MKGCSQVRSTRNIDVIVLINRIDFLILEHLVLDAVGIQFEVTKRASVVLAILKVHVSEEIAHVSAHYCTFSKFWLELNSICTIQILMSFPGRMRFNSHIIDISEVFVNNFDCVILLKL